MLNWMMFFTIGEREGWSWLLFLFSKHVGINDSNEVEVLAILEALCILSSAFHDNLIMQRNSMLFRGRTLFFQALGSFKLKQKYCLHRVMVSHHVDHSMNGMADVLTKQGVDRVSSLVASLIQFVFCIRSSALIPSHFHFGFWFPCMMYGLLTLIYNFTCYCPKKKDAFLCQNFN